MLEISEHRKNHLISTSGSHCDQQVSGLQSLYTDSVTWCMSDQNYCTTFSASKYFLMFCVSKC